MSTQTFKHTFSSMWDPSGPPTLQSEHRELHGMPT
jgi:hypothetical protein